MEKVLPCDTFRNQVLASQEASHRRPFEGKHSTVGKCDLSKDGRLKVSRKPRIQQPTIDSMQVKGHGERIRVVVDGLNGRV